MTAYETTARAAKARKSRDAMRRMRALQSLQRMCATVGLFLSPPSSMALWNNPAIQLRFTPIHSGSNRKFSGEGFRR